MLCVPQNVVPLTVKQKDDNRSCDFGLQTYNVMVTQQILVPVFLGFLVQ